MTTPASSVIARFLLATALVSFAHVPAISAPPLQPPPSAGLFPFAIPQDDALAGTATDMSALSSGPAGANGRIVVKDGHFVESGTGRRIRFVGLNTMYMFPEHAEAEARAAHYAKMGINLIRMHMVDPYWSELWKKPVGEHPEFNPAAVERMDYFFFQLEKRGIYLDINLHAGRQFKATDGFDPAIAKIPEAMDKHIDMINDRMIQLDEQYDKDYLTHINPYTHLTYAKDPAVAILEINNEDTLLYSGCEGPDNFYRRLPEPFRGECDAKWNDWLARKYQTTAMLRDAWADGPKLGPADPTELLGSTSAWTVEDAGGDVKMVTADSGTATTAPEIAVTNPAITTQLSAKQVHLAGLTLIEGARYVLSLRSKSDVFRVDTLSVGLDQKDWHNLGLSTTFGSGAKWQAFRYAFQAKNTVPGHGEISITVGGTASTLSIADVRLHRVTTDDILPPAQTLENHNVDLASGVSATQASDWLAFLSDLEASYSDRMRRYLKDNLAVDANVICSQISYGGMSGIRRELGSDFIDNHLYWGHPEGTQGLLEPRHWKIANTPLVSDLGKGKQEFLLWLAGMRCAGRPYTVSEYNHPAPSDYQAEALPMLTTFALAQDWDGIFWFADKGSGQPWFDIGGNPTKEAFFPAAAVMTRLGLIAPLTSSATFTPDAHLLTTRSGTRDAWLATAHNKPPNLLTTRLAYMSDPAVKTSRIDVTAQPSPGAPGGLRIVNTASGAEYIASGPAALACVGYIGGQIVTEGPVTLTFPAFGNNFATMTLTSNDGTPIPTSRRMLLTIVGHTECAGQVWNADRNSLGTKWGSGPTLAEGIPATVTLANPAVKRVWSLDPTGTRVKELPVTITGGKATFTIGPEYSTVWYEIAE